MEGLDFTFGGCPPWYARTPFGFFALECVLGFGAWCLFARHFKRGDRGAWRGAGVYVVALLPALVGLSGALHGLHQLNRGMLKTGSGGIGATSAGVADAFFPSAIGFWISAVVVASMFHWILRFADPPDGPSTVPGPWLLGGTLAGTLVVLGATLVIAILLTLRTPDTTDARRLIVVATAGALVLAIIAVAAIRRAPRAPEAHRRPHAVVAASLVVLLAAAGWLVHAASSHFRDVARHGWSGRP